MSTSEDEREEKKQLQRDIQQLKMEKRILDLENENRRLVCEKLENNKKHSNADEELERTKDQSSVELLKRMEQLEIQVKCMREELNQLQPPEHQMLFGC